MVETLWAKMCQGVREDKSKIEHNDPMWDKLNFCAVQLKTNPLKWFEIKEVYGNLNDNQSFKDLFVKCFLGVLKK